MQVALPAGSLFLLTISLSLLTAHIFDQTVAQRVAADKVIDAVGQAITELVAQCAFQAAFGLLARGCQVVELELAQPLEPFFGVRRVQARKHLIAADPGIVAFSIGMVIAHLELVGEVMAHPAAPSEIGEIAHGPYCRARRWTSPLLCYNRAPLKRYGDTRMNGMATPWRVWVEAARPRTLALALGTIGLGLLLAWSDGYGNLPVALLALLTAVLLQILSNLANDYGDSLHGADSAARAGPQRAVQSGRVSRRAMRRAVVLVVLLSMVSGLLMVWLAFGAAGLYLVLLFLLLGAAAIWAAIAYTASDRPYGYAGLGDLFVFLFFGLVAVGGGYFLLAQRFPPEMLLPAISGGLFSVGVLNINNIRDVDSDRQAGKYSIPVRVGPRRARLYHWVLLTGGFAAALIYVLLTYRSPWQLLFLLTAPLFVRNGLAVWRSHAPHELDPLLKQMSLTTLLFVISFGLGHLLAG